MNTNTSTAGAESLLPVAPGIYVLTPTGLPPGKGNPRMGYRCVNRDGRGTDFLFGQQPAPFDTLSPAARREYRLRMQNPGLEVLRVPFSALPEALGYGYGPAACANPRNSCYGELDYRMMITDRGLNSVLVCARCDTKMRL